MEDAHRRLDRRELVAAHDVQLTRVGGQHALGEGAGAGVVGDLNQDGVQIEDDLVVVDLGKLRLVVDQQRELIVGLHRGRDEQLLDRGGGEQAIPGVDGDVVQAAGDRRREGLELRRQGRGDLALDGAGVVELVDHILGGLVLDRRILDELLTRRAPCGRVEDHRVQPDGQHPDDHHQRTQEDQHAHEHAASAEVRGRGDAQAVEGELGHAVSAITRRRPRVAAGGPTLRWRSSTFTRRSPARRPALVTPSAQRFNTTRSHSCLCGQAGSPRLPCGPRTGPASRTTGSRPPGPSRSVRAHARRGLVGRRCRR